MWHSSPKRGYTHWSIYYVKKLQSNDIHTLQLPQALSCKVRTVYFQIRGMIFLEMSVNRVVNNQKVTWKDNSAENNRVISLLMGKIFFCLTMKKEKKNTHMVRILRGKKCREMCFLLVPTPFLLHITKYSKVNKIC